MLLLKLHLLLFQHQHHLLDHQRYPPLRVDLFGLQSLKYSVVILRLYHLIKQVLRRYWLNVLEQVETLLMHQKHALVGLIQAKHS